MRISYHGTPEELMQGGLEELRFVRENQSDHQAARMFEAGLCTLLFLHDAQAKHGPIAPERLQAFRKDFADALGGLSRFIVKYVLNTETFADLYRDEELWDSVCFRRSVIQTLLDGEAGPAAAAAVILEDVEAIDETLLFWGPRLGPVEESLIPKGLPESHWWWRNTRSPPS